MAENSQLLAEYRAKLADCQQPGHNAEQSRVFEKSAVKVFTTADAASVLRVSTRTVERMLKRGELPGRQLGRRWVIPVNAFMEWLNP